MRCLMARGFGANRSWKDEDLLDSLARESGRARRDLPLQTDFCRSCSGGERQMLPRTDFEVGGEGCPLEAVGRFSDVRRCSRSLSAAMWRWRIGFEAPCRLWKIDGDFQKFRLKSNLKSLELSSVLRR